MPAAILSLMLTMAALSDAEPPADAPAAGVEPEVPTEDAEVEAEDPEKLAAQAEQAFAEGRFDAVVDLAARAYALTGDPRHLYAQALAERRLGRCREALILYARVLASVEDDPTYSALVDGTRQGIKLCEASLDEDAEPEPKPEPEPEPESAVSVEDPPESEPGDDRAAEGPRPWFRDPLGGILLGSGLAIGGGAGGALWVLSSRELDTSEQATDETMYAESRTRARGLRTGAVASLTVGGSLLVGAIVRYVLVDRAYRRQLVTSDRSVSHARPRARRWSGLGRGVRIR